MYVEEVCECPFPSPPRMHSNDPRTLHLGADGHRHGEDDEELAEHDGCWWCVCSGGGVQ